MTDAVPGGKPKLVFFRFPDPTLPTFLSLHLDDHVNCLRRFFDVTVVAEDCDYDEVCDREQPDLTLFESGVYAGERKVTRTESHPDVPKLGFLNADAYSDTRAAFLSDMDRWGVEDFFTLAVSAPEYSPDFADRLFMWPNSVNPEVFRDYGVDKNIPVLLTGSQARHYPWRIRVGAVLAASLPTMVCPHFGWQASTGARRMIVGEQYARLLSAARFVPACGTIAKDVVRKHFEVPAAGTVLVTERTAAIEAAGFRDGVNCVFADAEDVVERVGALLDDQQEYDRVAAAGHALVHARHTWAHRDELLQWLQLHRAARPGEVIVQNGPFGGLSLAPGGPRRTGYPVGGGVDRAMLSDAWAAIAARRYPVAERLLLGCLNFVYSPEAVVALAYLELSRGRPDQARHRLARALRTTLEAHRAADPDPVQWALWIRTLLCCGDVPSARQAAGRFLHVRHEELDRTRQAVARLSGAEPAWWGPARSRPSMNPLPARTSPEWAGELARMLRACGRARLAAGLADWCPSDIRAGAPGGEQATTLPVPVGGGTDEVRAELRRASVPPLRTRARGRLPGLLQRLGDPPLARAVEPVLSKEPVSAVLVLGSPRRWGMVSSLRAGASANPGRPPVEVHRRTDPGTASAGRDDLMVYVGRAGIDVVPLLPLVRIVVLETLAVAALHELFIQLSEDVDWAVVAHEQHVDGSGFAVLRRVRWTR